MIRVFKVQAASSVLQLAGLLIGVGAAPHVYSQSFEQVTPGAAHICAIEDGGQVQCSTTPLSTRLLPPADLPLMREIAAGQQHTCGITLDDSIECWGTNSFGELDPPAFDAPVQSITAGFNHSCAIDINNQVQCWGLNTNGQLDVPIVAGGFVAVDVARVASCGIDTLGDVHCWSTDSFFPTIAPIPGPFVQLDLDANQACGLTANGDIECFASRERNGLSPPDNGPYTDLTVTNSAICGLRTDQLLDCSFAAPASFDLNTLADEYPLGEAFSSIERANFQFGAVGICGIRADSGMISCFGTQEGFESPPPPPGADTLSPLLTAANVMLSLTAEVYGPNQVELFWNQLPIVFPPFSVEVFRDDELLTTTTNRFSFFDNDSSVSGEESTYRVRTVDEAGNMGEFSNTIIVNRLTANVELGIVQTDVDNPRTDDMLLIQDLSIIAFDQFTSNNNDSFILSWNFDDSSSIEVAGFEIRIDGVPVGFVSGLVFTGEGASSDQCSTYSVAAIADDGEIIDFASVAFGDNTFACLSAR